MSAVHVLAVITAKPGKRAAILDAFRANVPAVHAENGCVEYGATIDAEDAGAIQTNDGLTCMFVAVPPKRFQEETRFDIIAGHQRVLTECDEQLAAATAGAELVFLGMRIPPNYGARYADAFHQMFSDVARTFDAPLLPFFLEGVALTPGMMQSDGIHPTLAAQPRLLDNAWAVLSRLI